MTLLVTVETGNMAQVLASRTGFVGGIDTDGWGGVFPSLFLTTVFLFLLPSFLVGGLAILGPQRVQGLELGRSLSEWAEGSSQGSQVDEA